MTELYWLWRYQTQCNKSFYQVTPVLDLFPNLSASSVSLDFYNFATQSVLDLTFSPCTHVRIRTLQKSWPPQNLPTMSKSPCYDIWQRGSKAAMLLQMVNFYACFKLKVVFCELNGSCSMICFDRVAMKWHVFLFNLIAVTFMFKLNKISATSLMSFTPGA